jgi:hypothetical protein
MVHRVPTKDNIADLPSREEYELLHAMRAQERQAVFDDGMLNPKAWKALCLEGVFI